LPSQDIEEALVKRDIKRQKLAEAKNVPGLVARVNEMNSTALRRRTKMMLPAPQVCVATTVSQCCVPWLKGCFRDSFVQVV
jgi:hypothetical protein